MDKKRALQQLLTWKGQTYASELGIDLQQAVSEEIFKWFLASILFGARISEALAKRTYQAFEQNGLNTPQHLLEAGWDRLVEVLDAGGYARYDFKTATKLLAVMQALQQDYQGDLNFLHTQAADSQDLVRRITDLGKGIGPVTVQIFLRELRGIWEKAHPDLSPMALLCARHLGWVEAQANDSEAMETLQQLWLQSGRPNREFPILETALLRVGKAYCRKNRCEACELKVYCQTYQD